MTLSNVQKITSAENLRSRAFDDLAIELNINCNRKIAEAIFKHYLKFIVRISFIHIIYKFFLSKIKIPVTNG